MRVKRLTVIAVVAVAFLAWNRHQERHRVETEVHAPVSSGRDSNDFAVERESTAVAKYQCDGRQYCSQMTSCEEATWHLEHCPDMKMDGDGDGEPCEDQWCRR